MRRILILSMLLSVPASAAETISYTYDARGRLIGVYRIGGINNGVQANYSYDKANNRSNVTVVGQVILNAGQSLWSPDGRFQLTMQVDGNLVLFGPDGYTWASGTNGGSSSRMVMQADGNLVVYNGANQALWASNTAGNPGSRLALQNDGNLVIYNSANAAIWATNTVYQPPAFAIGDTSATEGSTIVFTVSRNKSTSASYSINYASANGTAAASNDYGPVSGTLTFAPADATKSISITTVNDSYIEAAETLVVNLSGATGGATIADGQGIGTINDDDEIPPSFFISNASVTEGGNLVLTVTKSGTVVSSFSVNFATANGTAAAGSDYSALSGTLTFSGPETSKTVTIGTINDTAVESSETVLVNLSGATGGATIIDNQGVGTIIDNDAPAPSFAVSNFSGFEGGLISFTVTKSGSTSSTITVNYATDNNTAAAGSDYSAASGTLTFGPTETTKTVNIATIDNLVVEGTESFFLNLSGASGGATISDSQGVGTITDNDEEGGGEPGCPPDCNAPPAGAAPTGAETPPEDG